MFIGENGRKAYQEANKQHNIGRPCMYSAGDYRPVSDEQPPVIDAFPPILDGTEGGGEGISTEEIIKTAGEG